MKTNASNRFRLRNILAAACLLSAGETLSAPSPIVFEAFLAGTNAAGAPVSVTGGSAAIDGDTLVIRTVDIYDGSVCIFVRNGTTWIQQAFLQGGGFGAAAVSGNTVVVGASEAAYVFERTGTTWTQMASLKASVPQANMQFGSSVAISGDTIVVGAMWNSTRAARAGAAYVFVRGDSGWTQQAVLYASNAGTSDFFGEAVAISGNTIVAGAQYESSNATGVNGNQNNESAQFSGAAYVFVRNGATWTQQAYLKASNTEIYDYFGSAIAISGDTIIVGAANEDSSAAGVNGNQGNATTDGLFNSGAAYVFVRSGTTWTQQAYLKSDRPLRNAQFGTAVAAVGDFVMAGTYGFSGHEIQVFAREGTQWSSRARIDGSNSGSPRLFSWYLAASGDFMAAANSVFRGVGACTNCPPSFTLQPANQLVLPGTNVTLTCAVSSKSPVHYRWRFENVDIPGATNSTYSFTNVSLTNGHGNFSVVASNEFGSVTSSAAFVFVRVGPGIVTPPQPATVLQGQSLTLSVAATGAPPLAYRWLRGATTYVANGTATLQLANLQATTIYRVVVTNLSGTVASPSITVTVLPDHDRDGIADSWEVQHGLNTNDVMDALLDADADGMSNRDEYIGGTLPRDPASVLKLTLRRTGILQFMAQSNIAYTIQYRTNLTSAEWINLTNINAQPQTRTVSANASNSPPMAEQFYRVMTPPAP